MGKKLYIGNLPFSTTDEELTEIFSSAGKVSSAKIILDRMSGRSKGFGFVEMNTDEDAGTAITLLGGTQLQGRAITVNEARPMSPRSNSNTGRPPGNGGRGQFSRNRFEKSQRW